jgi:serine beta-lactamase-like protein LACTB
MDWTFWCGARSAYPKLFVGAIFLCAVVSQAQDQLLSPEKQAQIEAAVSKFMSSTHVPGLSVAVVEDGKYEWAAGFGLADLENNVPASEHTLFRLASISKPLTAVGAMELWERGKLDLDAPVQKYCPAFPRKSAPITIRQVMGHLGGIRHYKLDSLDDPEVGNTKHFDNPIQAGLDFSPETRAFLSRWNSDELVSQGCGFPLELLDL